MERASLKAKPKNSVYFKHKKKRKAIKSGCVLTDCAISGSYGGGWPRGRIINIVGDSSTGKTLLAEEACINFRIKFPEGHIWYREAESAFDEGYAEAIGLQLDTIDFGPEGLGTVWQTIESLMKDIKQCIAQAKESGQPGLYIIDSLDALTSQAELDRDDDESTYGLEKQKKLGLLFRKYVAPMERAGITVMIISQVRSKIGLGFGDKQTRSGGSALQFYASVVAWLSHMGLEHITVRGVKKAVGARIRMRIKKNKIAPPHRECEFVLKFGYGIDEATTMMTWLKTVNAAKEIDGFAGNVKDFVKKLEAGDDDDYRAAVAQMRKVTRRVWQEIEEDFAPKRRKYA